MATRRAKSQARRNTDNSPPGWVWLIAGAAITAVVFLAAPSLLKKNDGSLLHIGPHPNPNAQPAPVIDPDTAIGQSSKPTVKAPDKPTTEQPQYDFYTLLPGKEVPRSNADPTTKTNTVSTTRVVPEDKTISPKPDARTTVASGTPAPTTTNDPKPLPEPLSPRPTPVPITVTPTQAPPANTPPAAMANTTRYMLQAGSFGTSSEAESTKARLAMLGLTARIESANIGGKQVYRVRMGPYDTAHELAEARGKIDGNGLQAITIKAH